MIRAARPADRGAIRDVVTAAFGQPYEADLVDRLLADGDAVIELVAEIDRAIVGHVLFSRLIAPFPALALGPLSVRPSRQAQGTGGSLVREGLARAAAGKWIAVFVLGDPAYYTRFGFDLALAAGFASPFAGAHFMALALDGPLPATAGEIRHARAFSAS